MYTRESNTKKFLCMDMLMHLRIEWTPVLQRVKNGSEKIKRIGTVMDKQ